MIKKVVVCLVISAIFLAFAYDNSDRIIEPLEISPTTTLLDAPESSIDLQSGFANERPHPLSDAYNHMGIDSLTPVRASDDGVIKIVGSSKESYHVILVDENSVETRYLLSKIEFYIIEGIVLKKGNLIGYV